MCVYVCVWVKICFTERRLFERSTKSYTEIIESTRLSITPLHAIYRLKIGRFCKQNINFKFSNHITILLSSKQQKCHIPVLHHGRNALVTNQKNADAIDDLDRVRLVVDRLNTVDVITKNVADPEHHRTIAPNIHRVESMLAVDQLRRATSQLHRTDIDPVNEVHMNEGEDGRHHHHHRHQQQPHRQHHRIRNIHRHPFVK